MYSGGNRDGFFIIVPCVVVASLLVVSQSYRNRYGYDVIQG